MKGLITLLLIIFFGWCFGSTYWYVCKIKGLCEEPAQEETATTPETEKVETGNLLFAKSSTEPETNDATITLFDSLKNLSIDTLVIDGKYFSNEEGGQQLGLNRASKVRDLLLANGFDKPTLLSSTAIVGQLSETKYRAIDFQPIINPDEEDTGGFTYTATDSKIVINFPVASADPHGDAVLTEKLKKFASMAAENNQKVIVSGHTDNTGTHDANIQYGQLRADVISNLLIEYGMDKNNINAVSKGESQPLATNDTEEGRKQNRRVEIEIIPN